MNMKLSIYKNFALVAMCILCVSFQTYAQENASPKIEVKQVAAQKAAVIKVTVPTNVMGQKMGELYGKLFGYLGANKIQPVGAAFAVYYEYDPKGNTVFEVGVPIASPIQGNDEIKFKEFPAMKVLATLYVGPYEKIGPVYVALTKYASDNKIVTLSTPWEVYLTDPNQVKDPNKYQTMVYFPVK
jgi:effector-binding domain-containing protein